MKKSQMKDHSVWLSGLLGAVIALCSGVLLSLVVPILFLNEMLDVKLIGLFANVTLGISSFTGAIIVGVVSKENKMISTLMTIGSFVLFLLCAALLFFDGVSANVLQGLLSILIGGVIAFMITRRKKISPKRKTKKSHNR